MGIRCSRSRETSGDARNDQILTNSATKILNGVALHRLPRRRRQTNRVEQGPCRGLRLGVKRLNQQTPSWMGSRTSPQRGTQTRSNHVLSCSRKRKKATPCKRLARKRNARKKSHRNLANLLEKVITKRSRILVAGFVRIRSFRASPEVSRLRLQRIPTHFPV